VKHLLAGREVRLSISQEFFPEVLLRSSSSNKGPIWRTITQDDNSNVPAELVLLVSSFREHNERI
jgi:hypothetical protein